jgi:hypothetical protein
MNFIWDDKLDKPESRSDPTQPLTILTEEAGFASMQDKDGMRLKGRKSEE